MAQFGTGGTGGFINGNIAPFIANPTSFIFLNGNSGISGKSSNTDPNNSFGNANVGTGGSGAGSGGYDGGGGGY